MDAHLKTYVGRPSPLYYAERLSQRVLAYEGVTQKDKPIAQAHLSEARVRLRALRGLLDDTVGQLETHVAAGDPVPRTVRGEARLAAAHIVHESRAVIARLLGASGASAHFLDNPPKITPGHGGEAVSPGDELLGTNPIAIEGKVVGKIRMVCTATSSGTVENAGFICSGVAKIPGGRLFLEGEAVQGPNEGAITGGTGTYAGARGTFLSRHGKGGSTTVVTLLE